MRLATPDGEPISIPSMRTYYDAFSVPYSIGYFVDVIQTIEGVLAEERAAAAKAAETKTKARGRG